MKTPRAIAAKLAGQLHAAPRRGRRKLIAMAGPPASGKSTLAQHVADELNKSHCSAAVVPMDGFHLDNDLLKTSGLLARKGAPETFDATGFLHLVARLRDEDVVYYPTFDRTRDIAIAASGRIGTGCDTVIIEGNYLLFDAPIWRDLEQYWDISVRLAVPDQALLARLVARWQSMGLSKSEATDRARQNDMANARLIAATQIAADITI